MPMSKFAEAIGVPKNRIHLIVKGNRGITADTDLRLCRYFGLSEGFWLRLQNQYDLMEAKRRKVPLSHIKPYKYQNRS